MKKIIIFWGMFVVLNFNLYSQESANPQVIEVRNYIFKCHELFLYRLKAGSNFQSAIEGFIEISEDTLNPLFWEPCGSDFIANPGDVIVVEQQKIKNIFSLEITGLENNTFSDFDMGLRYFGGDRKGKVLILPKNIVPNASDFIDGKASIKFIATNSQTILGNLQVEIRK